MKAVILCAGEGTRLRPITLDIPKPLIRIGDKPIIERILDALPEEVDEVILIVDYLKDKIIDHLGDKFGDKKITYVTQGEKKGTFGALLSARSCIKEGGRFLVLNGDDLISKKDLEKFLINERAFGLQHKVMPRYYGVNIEEGRVVGFRPQTEEEKSNGTLIATGAYLLDTNIFNHPGVGVFGGELGLPQTILEQKDAYPIRAVITENWEPINSLEDIERANKL